MSPEALDEFVWNNRLTDPATIALSAGKRPDLPAAYLAGQIDALQKIRTKVPSWYRPGLHFPPALSLEQASSEATARFKAGLIEGRTMADLSGGMGIDSFFLAQRFESATHVEPNAELSALTRHNFDVLRVKNTRFVVDTSEDFLQKTADPFDLLYLDPSRRHEQKGKVIRLEDCSPNILSIKTLALEKSRGLLLKTAPLLDIRLAAGQLETVRQIWVLASGPDCREVLYLLGHEPVEVDLIPIHAVQLHKDGPPQTFAFTYQAEKNAAAPLSLPQQYLYEPNAAILKAGAFRSFAEQYGLHKLHPNTHLYTSGQFVSGLPARSFVIEALCKYDRKAVAAHVPGSKAHVSTRNFPDKAELVRKKLGLHDGGEFYVFAFTDAEEKKVVAVCKKTGDPEPEAA